MISKRLTARAMLGAILVVALGWRLHNIGFGLPSMYDPDEPMFMITALKMLAEGSFNPGWFGHPGSTTIYLVAAIDAVVASTGLVFGHYADLDAFAKAAYADPAMLFVPARVAMALIGTACVWLVYRLGTRLDRRATGLIAAGLLAINAAHIAWSQVIRTDINAGAFMLASLLFAARIADAGRVRDYLFAGAFAGLATATKWPAAIVFVAVVGATIHFRQTHAVRKVAASAGAALAAMFVASPFIFLDWRTVLANVSGEISPGHLGQNGDGFLANLTYYLTGPIVGSMGWIGLVLAIAGGAILAVRRPVARWTLLPATLLFLGLLATQNVIFERWLMPLIPMACLFAAAAIVAIADRLSHRLALPIIAILAAIPSFSAAVARSLERSNDTRAEAARWAVAHIPPGSRVVFEHLELSIRDRPWTILFPIGEAGCIDGKKALSDGVDYDAVQSARGSSPIVDLGHVARGRLVSCRADYAILVYYDLYLVESARYPAELATYRAALAGGRTLALFRPVAGQRGGPIVRILALPKR